MPSPEQVNLYHAAVLFAATGTNDKYGNPVRGTPVEIRVRWDDKAAEAVDPNGKTIKVDATAVVKQDITIGSLMRLGTLVSWLGTGSVATDDRLMEVVTFNKVPDIRNRFIFRKVGLMRWHNN